MDQMVRRPWAWEQKAPARHSQEPGFGKSWESGIHGPILSPVYTLDMSNVHLSEESLGKPSRYFAVFDFYKTLCYIVNKAVLFHMLMAFRMIVIVGLSSYYSMNSFHCKLLSA